MRSFGFLKDGREAHLFTLVNVHGIRAEVTNYGGILVQLCTPDRQGHMSDIVLGYNNVADYEANNPYFGATCGRVGNRIAHGRFSLDGVTYQLATNNAPAGIPCHLHGGKIGYDKILWQASSIIAPGATGLRLTHRSPDGDEGYPGNLDLVVTYWLTDANELKIEYSATTDRATPVNLTNHSYFNLRGDGQGDILGHELTVCASHFTAVNAGLIPTGVIAPVGGTPLDFTAPHTIGSRINADDEQLRFGAGYDHNFIIDKPAPGAFALAAKVYEPTTGRVMEVWTEEPGVQFYSGNFLNDTFIGKTGKPYGHRTGFCLETQHAPDSVNQPTFPSIILRPGSTYRTLTTHRFSTR